MKDISLMKAWWRMSNNHTYPIAYYNFWEGQSADQIWFTDFLKGRDFFDRYPDCRYSFFSPLGDAEMILLDKKLRLFQRHVIRIFFTGENVHYESFNEYSNNLIDSKIIDLSLGFDNINSNKYLRFPLWILEMFPANSSKHDIKLICERLNYQRYDDSRSRFCAMVSGGGTNLLSEHLLLRKEIVRKLTGVAKVDCAGRFLRNTDELQTVYHDDKAEFLKRYKFFICPENTSVEGYVTEKVFHSIGSGCIPIYYGSNNNPEPDVLNHNAILFWNPGDDNESLVRKVEELWNNPKLYKEFFEQPRLQPNAWEVVANYFDSLEKKLNEICSR